MRVPQSLQPPAWPLGLAGNPRALPALLGAPGALPLTYQGTGRCCRTWFASRDPRRGCLRTGGACRCACGPGSPGRRCWSTGSRGTTRPRRRALRRSRGAADPAATGHGCPTPDLMTTSLPCPPNTGCRCPARPAPLGLPHRVRPRAHLDTRPSCCTAAARAGARCTACCRRRTRKSACGSASPRRTCWSTRSTGTTPRPRGHLRADPQPRRCLGARAPPDPQGDPALRGGAAGPTSGPASAPNPRAGLLPPSQPPAEGSLAPGGSGSRGD